MTKTGEFLPKIRGNETSSMRSHEVAMNLLGKVHALRAWKDAWPDANSVLSIFGKGATYATTANTLGHLYLRETGRALEMSEPPGSLSQIDAYFDFPEYISETAINNERERVILENERLKSEAIANGRALLEAKKRQEQLSAQNKQLVDSVCDLTSLNSSIVATIDARRDARVCLNDSHSGVVTDATDAAIEVTFQTADGPILQVYARTQLMPGIEVRIGDRVDAHIFIVRTASADSSPRRARRDIPHPAAKGLRGQIKL